NIIFYINPLTKTGLAEQRILKSTDVSALINKVVDVLLFIRLNDIGKFSHFFHESLAFLLWIPLYLMSVLIFYERTQANPSFQKKDGNLESNLT
nr:hypothetical protein [Saprospiraceae bacterium]